MTKDRWQWRATPYSPKLQYYRNLTIRLFNVIYRTLVGAGVLALCREAVGVFYNPSGLGKISFFKTPYKYIYIYIYVCVCVCVCVCISGSLDIYLRLSYIYIYREREWERKKEREWKRERREFIFSLSCVFIFFLIFYALCSPKFFLYFNSTLFMFILSFFIYSCFVLFFQSFSIPPLFNYIFRDSFLCQPPFFSNFSRRFSTQPLKQNNTRWRRYFPASRSVKEHIHPIIKRNHYFQ